MSRVVKELVTKWTYKVDTTQLKQARAALKGIKSEMTKVRKSSIAFGKGELNRVRRVRDAWSNLNRKVRQYGTEVTTSGRKAQKAQGAGALAGGFKGFAALRGLGVGAGAAAGLAAGPGVAAITAAAGSVRAFAQAVRQG